MEHASLFSGIGGFDLAAEWMKWNNVFHCENNEFCKTVLKYYWPNAISYGDIKETDFTIHRGSIDILTGGFPCQPYSLAGKRKGAEDDRHLWPWMVKAIQEIQPRYIVGENVYGLVNWDGGLVFEQIQTDLEAEGYEVQPVILPAVSVNAPHRRDRIWFVAHNTNSRIKGVREREDCIYKSGYATNARLLGQEERQVGTMGVKQLCEESDATESSSERCDNGSDNREKRHIQGNEGATEEDKPERKGRECGVCEISETTPNPDSRRQPSEEHREEEPGRITETGLRNNWENFPTQPPVCSRDDELSSSIHSKAISKEHNMDRNIVIKGAIDEGRLIADSKTGKVFSTTLRGKKGQKIELPGCDCNGYTVHGIYYNGIHKQIRAHQVVWISANGLYDKDKLMIDHINRDKKDNRLDNLRLVDAKGNKANAPDPQSRYSDDEKDAMFMLHNDGHMSFREIAEDFGCSKSRAHQIVSDHKFNKLDGITFPKWRNESIKAYGNAVVPELVYEIFKVIQEIDNQ